MKKLIVLIIIFSMLAVNASFADGPIKKLGRGLANIITCPLEIPKRISDANAESGPIAASTFGVLNGLFQTCIRAFVGVYETVTFFIPIPVDYGPVLTDPEFFLDEGLF